MCFCLNAHLRFPVQHSPVLKFSNDSVREGHQAEYRKLVNCVVTWCGYDHLTLNVNKTIIIIVNFRKKKNRSKTITITGAEVEDGVGE